MLHRIGTIAAAIALLAGLARAAYADSPHIDFSQAPVVVVKLSSYAFTPDTVRLRQGQPVRLMLENDAGSSHDFTAPGFFEHVAYGSGIASPPDGSVYLDGGDKVELDLVPKQAGSYPVECTHFMHGFFGMKGTIEVAPAG